MPSNVAALVARASDVAALNLCVYQIEMATPAHSATTEAQTY